jgi:hypothetical protein
MTDEEKSLRDNINRELEQLGFHLRVSTLFANVNETIFDFLPPIGKWIGELSDVDSLVARRIKEWQRMHNL